MQWEILCNLHSTVTSYEVYPPFPKCTPQNWASQGLGSVPPWVLILSLQVELGSLLSPTAYPDSYHTAIQEAGHLYLV